MTDDRATVFAALRASLEGRKEPTPYPEYPADVATPHGRRGGGLEVFRARLAAANTLVLDGPRDLADFLRGHGASSGYCDPALAPLLAAGLGPQIEVHTDLDRERIDDYQFGITRASAGIIETGSETMDSTICQVNLVDVEKLTGLFPPNHGSENEKL